MKIFNGTSSDLNLNQTLTPEQMLIVARQKSREAQKKEVSMRMRVLKRDIPKHLETNNLSLQHD